MWVVLRYFSQSCKQDFTPPIDFNECHKKKSVTNSRQGEIEHKHLIGEHAVITTTLLFHDKTGFYQTLQPWPGVAYTSNRTKTNHHKPIIKQRSPHRSWKVWWEEAYHSLDHAWFTPTQHFFTALPSMTPGTQRVTHLLDREGKEVWLHEGWLVQCSSQAPVFSRSNLLAI